MERVLLLDLREEKAVGCCNIARVAKSWNKIAAIGEQKFPAIRERSKPCGVVRKKIEPIKWYDKGDVPGYRQAA
jgi:hypothetical protein